MASGIPVISTKHAGIPESVMDGKTGILVNEGDQSALVDAFKKMLDHQFRSSMGIKAHNFTRLNFDLELCNKNLQQIYLASVEMMD